MEVITSILSFFYNKKDYFEVFLMAYLIENWYNLSLPNILILHFTFSLLIGFLAKKYYDRTFFIWFVISFITPIIGGIFLFILGYDGIYCPNCKKKMRKNLEICPHCSFNVKEFLELEKSRADYFKKNHSFSTKKRYK